MSDPQPLSACRSLESLLSSRDAKTAKPHNSHDLSIQSLCASPRAQPGLHSCVVDPHSPPVSAYVNRSFTTESKPHPVYANCPAQFGHPKIYSCHSLNPGPDSQGIYDIPHNHSDNPISNSPFREHSDAFQSQESKFRNPELQATNQGLQSSSDDPRQLSSVFNPTGMQQVYFRGKAWVWKFPSLSLLLFIPIYYLTNVKLHNWLLELNWVSTTSWPCIIIVILFILVIHRVCNYRHISSTLEKSSDPIFTLDLCLKQSNLYTVIWYSHALFAC